MNWAASGTVSEGVGGSVVGTGLLSVVGAVTGEFSGVVSGVIHPAVRIHEMAMNSKKKFILDVMNKGTLIPINRCPPWILSEKRMVMREAGAIYPCIAGRGFHPIMGLSAFSNENHFVIFIIYARIPKSGLIGVYMKMPPEFSCFMLVALEGSVLFLSGEAACCRCRHYHPFVEETRSCPPEKKIRDPTNSGSPSGLLVP